MNTIPYPGPHDDEPDLRVIPGADGCICGMRDFDPNADGGAGAYVGPIFGGDCRSLGCDPYCLACNPNGPEESERIIR